MNAEKDQQWILNIIKSCNNDFHFEGVDNLIGLFSCKHGNVAKFDNLLYDLIDSRNKRMESYSLNIKLNKKMARQKKKVFVAVNIESAQDASEQYAIASNKLAKVEAAMNEQINKVKSKYQDTITELKESLEEPMELLQVYAQEQKETWGKKKSLELLHCTIGFRTGTPKVTKSKGFTWEGITEIVTKLFPHLVRTKTELDKDTIIAMRDEDGFSQIKDSCYIDVVQDETFFVQPKVEELVPA